MHCVMNISRSTRWISTLTLLACSAAAQSASADIKLFRADENTSAISGEFKVAPEQMTSASAQAAVREFLSQHTGELAMDPTSSLKAGVMEQNSDGSSLRFAQTVGDVPLDGAELVAIFGNGGELQALNSSLLKQVELQEKNTSNKAIAHDAARSAGTKKLGIKLAKFGSGNGDGLRYVADASGKYVLVHQFSVMDLEGGLAPLRVRVLAQGEKAGEIHSTREMAHEIADVIIHDASISLVTPGMFSKGARVLHNGKKTAMGLLIGGKVAKAASSNISKTLKYYLDTFNRNSYDNAGAPIHAAVNVKKIHTLDLMHMRQNAAWMSPFKMFVFGSGGKQLDYFESCLDVIGHEYTHAVVDATSSLEYEGQSGALNEHLADLFGVMIQENYEHNANPWLVGEGVLKPVLQARVEALRDMMHPEKGLNPQPGKVSRMRPEYATGCTPSGSNDHCGVHSNSGIPNRAAALIVSSLGWEKTKGIFYRVMTQRLRSRSNFADYRKQTLDECASKLSSSDCKAMKDAFDATEM